MISPASGKVTVSVPMSPPVGWIEDHRTRLAKARQALLGWRLLVGPQGVAACCSARARAGVDTTVIALWLGRAGLRPTDAHVRADMTVKEKALSRTAPGNARPGRCQPTDRVLAFLDRL